METVANERPLSKCGVTSRRHSLERELDRHVETGRFPVPLVIAHSIDPFLSFGAILAGRFPVITNGECIGQYAFMIHLVSMIFVVPADNLLAFLN